MSVLVLSVTEI